MWERIPTFNTEWTNRRVLAIVATTAITSSVLTLLIAYFVVRWQFNPGSVNAVSIDTAVAHFRSTKACGKAAAGPAVGVYRYKATGYYQIEVPVLGNDRRTLPATVAGTVVHLDGCWELTLDFFKQHSWTGHYCRNAGGDIAMRFGTGRNEYFQRKVRWAYACKPADVVRTSAEPGQTWKQVCKPPQPKGPSPTKHSEVTFIGFETIVVDGKRVRTRHVKRVIHTEGQQAGATVRNLWFDDQSGLLVRLREHSSSSGLASFKADWGVELASTTPTK